MALDRRRAALAGLLLDRAPELAALGAGDLPGAARATGDEALARRIEAPRAASTAS